MPAQDVVQGGSDEETACVGVGCVDEYLVVDAVVVGGAGDIDEPEGFVASGECRATDAVLGCLLVEGLLSGGVGVEGFKVGFLGVVGSGFGCGSAAGGVGASPAGGAFAGFPVLFAFSLADGASWSVFSHRDYVTVGVSTGVGGNTVFGGVCVFILFGVLYCVVFCVLTWALVGVPDTLFAT